LILPQAKQLALALKCKFDKCSGNRVLRAGGSRLDLVVNTTVLVSDISNFPQVNDAFSEYFPENPPARMTMQVPLPRGLLISIGCVAVVED
jgi:2-iminobutanoate/2-iminopropanoate deaminase